MTSLLELIGASVPDPAPAEPIPVELQEESPIIVPEQGGSGRQIVIQGNQQQQQAFLVDCLNGNTLAQGGWGSGKSWIGSRKFLILHYINRCPGFIVAPTWADLARLMVPYLIAACQEYGIACEYWPSGRGRHQFPHMRIFGQLVYLFSGDAPQRITGFEAWGGWGDEAARFKTSENPLEDAPTQIKGRIRHKEARVLHWIDTTTPEGLSTYIQANYIDKPLPEHRAYFLRTKANKALPEQYITNLLNSIPDGLQGQYLEGHAVDYSSNRAHPQFSVERNVRDMPIDPQKTVHIGCDFNVSPMCWLMGQFLDDGRFIFLDELDIADNGMVDIMVHQAHARGWGLSHANNIIVPRKVRVHPDKSSKNRKTTSDPEFTTLIQTARNLGWSVDGTAAGANPPISSRINNMGMRLLNANGVSMLLVHPRCEKLIRELQRTGRKSDGSYDEGPLKKFGHRLDAAGYLVWDLFPIQPHVQFSR